MVGGVLTVAETVRCAYTGMKLCCVPLPYTLHPNQGPQGMEIRGVNPN